MAVAHCRAAPPLMLIVEEPVLHLYHWALRHVNFDLSRLDLESLVPQMVFTQALSSSFVGKGRDSKAKQGPRGLRF